MSNAIQSALDALRSTRNGLYEITRPELSSWSLRDQEKYANNLHRIGQDIALLETALIQGPTNALTQQVNTLKQATEKLEQLSESQGNLLLIVRNINSGLNIVDEIASLAR